MGQSRFFRHRAAPTEHQRFELPPDGLTAMIPWEVFGPTLARVHEKAPELFRHAQAARSVDEFLKICN
jgi:hypothetical protein